MEKYLDDEEITAEDIKRAIRKGTLAFRFVPVLCGSAFKNKGVQPLLDAVVDYLPSPLDVPPTKGIDPKGNEELERPADEKAPFAALAFKIVADPYGKLTYFRVYSGTLEKGAEVYNSTKDRKERIGRILLMHANHREDIDVVFAGDIVAGIGLKDTTTGDTLCDEKHPIVLEPLEFPEPVIHVAVEPKTKVDQDKMGKALYSLSEEDPTFQVRTDEETGQTDHLRHGRAAPRGARRPHAARVQRRRHRRQAAGGLPRDDHQAGREGRVPPREADRRLGPVRPRRHRPRAHRPRRRLRVRRQDHRRSHPEGVHPLRRPGHPGVAHRGRARRLPDSSTCGSRSRTARTTTSTRRRWRSRSPARWPSRRRPARPTPVLLEPIMAVEVVTPEDYMGDVIGDLSSRRGQVEGMEQRGNSQVVRAQVPSVGDVRLRYRPSFAHPGPRHVHDAVRLLPADARVDPGRDRQAGPGRVARVISNRSHRTPKHETTEGSEPPWPRRSLSGTSRI